MKNPNEMSVNEIKELVYELYSDEKAKEILMLPMDQVIAILEEDEACLTAEATLESQKHTPSRKKKANRTKKQKTTYKKDKDKKWIEKKRTNVPDEETSSRSYLNKASKGYNKLHPHVKPKAKKQEKK